MSCRYQDGFDGWLSWCLEAFDWGKACNTLTTPPDDRSIHAAMPLCVVVTAEIAQAPIRLPRSQRQRDSYGHAFMLR